MHTYGRAFTVAGSMAFQNDILELIGFSDTELYILSKVSQGGRRH
ncbi:MAG: hypothetical protein ACI9Y8_001378 [Candidatus Omnitrophota bacterium]|jgi:hypothetical protein